MKLNKKVNVLKATTVFLLILAIVFYYFEEIKVSEKEIDKTEVIVAVVDIPENTVIKKEMLSIEKRYTADVEKTEFIVKTYDEIVGKRAIVPIYKAEQININRIIENKEYMNSKKQTQVVIALKDVDKALGIKENDYIDIWLEPISQEQDNLTVIEPRKLIERIQVIEVHDVNFNIINNNQNNILDSDALNSSSEKDSVPSYITIELDDTALKGLYSIDKSQFDVRINRYGEEKIFSLINGVKNKE